MQEQDVSLRALSDVSCRFAVRTYHEHEDGFYCVVLIAAFTGEFRHGAEGNPDGAYMSAMLRAALSAWNATALVLDFTDLDYVWGDMMEAPLRVGEEYFSWEGGMPTRAVISSRNAPALRSLIDEMMGEDLGDWLCATREEAVTKVAEIWRARRSAPI